MNATLRTAARGDTPAPDVAVALLGPGAVGRQLLAQLAARRPAGLRLCAVADSGRQLARAQGIAADGAVARVADQAPQRADAEILAALDDSGAARRVIVDATASVDVARRHPFWLARGYHVVTANKALNGGSQANWHAIDAATRSGVTRYGASATVGAGLPVVDTLRRWHLSGDRVSTIEGVFSGSLSWLFNHYDANTRFSDLLRQAGDAGYCEPDPRVDLGGVDVARKLLILARSAGAELEPQDVQVDSLVPQALRDLPLDEFRARLGELDGPISDYRQQAQANGQVLRHLARFDGRSARVGLVPVEREHPAAHLGDTENLFVLSSASYENLPIIIRGPGAGTTVTAQALLADIMQLV